MTYEEALTEAGIQTNDKAKLVKTLFEEMTVNDVKTISESYNKLTLKEFSMLESEFNNLDSDTRNIISEQAKGMTSVSGYLASAGTGTYTGGLAGGLLGVVAYYFYKKSRKQALLRDVRKYCGEEARTKVASAYDDRDETVIKNAVQCVLDKKRKEEE